MTDRLLFSALICGAALFLTSCSDPAGVGASLGDRPIEDDSVATRSIPVDSVGTTEAISVTGNQLEINPISGEPDRAWRFLFGAVDDPLSGPITAEGYVDFSGTTARDSALAAADLDSLDAELRLRTTYLHGDTSSTLDVQLFDLASEADMNGAEADTTFEAESQAIDTYQNVSLPADSLFTFELPESWIEENQDVLQDSLGFGSDFNGFKVATAGGDLVVGVEHSTAILRLSTREDTVDFQSLKSFTHLEQTGSPRANLDDWIRIQDGVGQRLLMKWDFDRPLFADTLRNNPLNKADVTVPVDTNKMKQELPANPNFVRPPVNNYRVLATRRPDAPGCPVLGLQAFSQEGDRCLVPTDASSSPGAARLSSQAAFTTFERVLFDEPIFSLFEVEAAVRENEAPRNTNLRGLPSTLPVLVKTTNARIELRPRATLTYTPL